MNEPKTETKDCLEICSGCGRWYYPTLSNGINACPSCQHAVHNDVRPFDMRLYDIERHEIL